MSYEVINYATETKSLYSDLTNIENKIKILEKNQVGGYTSRVASSFYLGMVGGSGKNIHKLNRRRGKELDKTIDNAIILVGLYKQRDELKSKIHYIESGKRDADLLKKQNNNKLMAEYWKSIKVGDLIDVGGNDRILVTKKNNKSLETGAGCKWAAAEIIGKQAASLL